MGADFAVELAWKSALLAAVVLTMLRLMRRHDPSHRAAVGGLGLAVLLLLPVIIVAGAILPVPSIDVATPASSMPMVPLATDQGAISVPFGGLDAGAPTAPSVSAETIIALLWAAGCLSVIGRLGAGLLTLKRWTASAKPVSSPAWTDLLSKSGAPVPARLLVSDKVSAPLSWGWRRPVILIDRDTLARPEQAEAVIAHEAAHLNRLDWPRLLAARFAVALFWFNPLVWLLERRHLQAVEEAADAAATSRVEPAQYAQTLLNVARGYSPPIGANCMAHGTLSKRIRQVLNPRMASPRERVWRTGALAGVVMIAGPVAVIQFVAPAVSAAVAATPSTVAPAAPLEASSPIVAAAAQTAPVAAVQAAPATEPEPERAIVDREALDEVLQAAEEARAHAEVAMRDAEQIVARARVEATAAMANMRTDMLRGADDMDRGAIDMRKGAADMREEARKLRDPAYRAEQIRKAAARGDRVPADQELIDAIPKMEEGARKMDAGVEKMREGAKRMREQAQRS